MTMIEVDDGQSRWVADWDDLRDAMELAGWDIYGRGFNHRAVEPEADDPLEAYTALCNKVADEEGVDDEDIATMTFAPSEGAGVWVIHGI